MRYGVTVALQILVLSVQVRILVSQQNSMKKLFATLCFAVMLLYPQTGSTHEMPDDGHARPFIGVEIGGFSEFSALKEQRQDAYAEERKAYFYAVPSVGIANCFKKVTFEISIRTLIIPGITVEKGSWESGIGVVLGLTF